MRNSCIWEEKIISIASRSSNNCWKKLRSKHVEVVYIQTEFKPINHIHVRTFASWGLVRGGECGAGCWPYQRQINRQILSANISWAVGTNQPCPQKDQRHHTLNHWIGPHPQHKTCTIWLCPYFYTTYFLFQSPPLHFFPLTLLLQFCFHCRFS